MLLLPSLFRPALRGLLLLLLCAVLTSADAAPARWIKVEADSFTVLSDAPEPAVRDAAVRYAAYRRVFGEFFLEPGASLPPSVLLLFRTEKAFRANVPESKQARTKMVNYHVDVDGAPLQSFALAGDRDQALAMTFEFETIWGLNRAGYAVPVWMSQGAGEVLHGITLRKGRCLVGDTRRTFRDVYPWPRFFEIGESSKAYNDFNELSDFLDQAMGLMHWVLLKDDQSRARVADLAVRLRSSTGPEAIEAVMGLPPEQWTRAIHQHLSRTDPRALAFDEQAERARLRVTPAPEAEVLATTANLLTGWGETVRADALLDRALTLDPVLPAVQEASARRMLRMNRPDEAARLYREAIAAGTRNFSAYLRSADARLNDTRVGGVDKAGEGGQPAEKAAEEIRQAIKLNPGSSEAYQLLGRAFWMMPKIGEAELAELSRGPLTGERGQAVRFYRSLACSRLGREAEADADLRAIIADPQASHRSRQMAQQRLVAEQIRRRTTQVTALLNEQKYAEARTAAQATVDGAEEDQQREVGARMLQAIDEHEAWARLVDLQEAASWVELDEAATKFAADFPQSPLAVRARRLAETAAQFAEQENRDSTKPSKRPRLTADQLPAAR